ncbi:hypothetical protein FQN50_006150 [Emmonsiellopsis sp. PD_5]|nr:hypothetical protein FQN50_006150 [Emmonsiellopsis sp. PD_5]
MSLSALPPELLLEIVDYLTTSKGICAFAMANRCLHTLLHRCPIRFNVKHGSSSGLKWAARYSRLDLAEAFLDNGADVNAEKLESHPKEKIIWTRQQEWDDKLPNGIKRRAPIKYHKNSTPLHFAAINGDYKMVKLLLQSGANVNSMDDRNRTPLQFAAYNRHLIVTYLLLEGGAYVDGLKDSEHLRFEDEETPLTQATWHGNKEMIELLISAGADPNLWGIGHSPPIIWAIMCRNLSITKMLIDKGGSLTVQAVADPPTPLHAAAYYSDEEMINMLLDHGANVDQKSFGGTTPLFSAVDRGCEKVVKFLLEKGAEPNHRDNRDRTPLFNAVNCGHETIFDLLVKRGADTSHRGLLLLAITQRHESIVKKLLDLGSDPNARRSSEAYTPLHLAIHYGYTSIAKMLVDFKADIDAVADLIHRETPLSMAIVEDREEIALMLVKSGANTGDMKGARWLRFRERYKDELAGYIPQS